MRRNDDEGQVVLWQVVATRERQRHRIERLLEENGYRVARGEVLPNDIRLNTVRATIVITEGEQQVIQAWLDCDTRKQVAERLHVSEETVASHAHSIFRKLNVSNRHRAIVEAIRVGVLAITPTQKEQPTGPER